MSDLRVVIQKSISTDGFCVYIVGHKLNMGFKSYVAFTETYKDAFNNAKTVSVTINTITNPEASRICIHSNAENDMVKYHDKMGIEKLEVIKE